MLWGAGFPAGAKFAGPICVLSILAGLLITFGIYSAVPKEGGFEVVTFFKWIEVGNLSPRLRKVEGTLARIAPKKGTLKEMMVQVERWLLAEALREHDNNKTKTAQSLGITREGLHKKLSKFGM